MGLITFLLHLVLHAAVSLRGSAAVLALADAELALGLPRLPHWSTGRLWLLRLGYYQLHRPKEHADDWVWIIDHSQQTGATKCLLILGLRASALPAPGECLRLEHLEPLEVLPVSSSTQHDVLRQLHAVAQRTGVPRAIVRDDGGDLRGGVSLFCAEHPLTLDVYDVKHKTACLLQKRLEGDERWAGFSRQAGLSKNQTQHTELAFLAPPTQRSKSRYMNLEGLLGWAERALAVLAEPARLPAGVSQQRLQDKRGWLRDYQQAVAEWAQWLRLCDTTVEFVRRDYLYPGAADDLAECLEEPARPSSGALRAELLAHVRRASEQLRPGERLPGSSEVLESCFGKFKAMEKTHSRSGLTGLLLGLGAVVAQVSSDVVQAALEQTPVKKVLHWCRSKLGPSVQAQRRAAAAPPDAQQKPDKPTPASS